MVTYNRQLASNLGILIWVITS